MNRTGDQDPAFAIDDQCSVIILHIGTEQRGSVNAEKPEHNQHNMCCSHVVVFWHNREKGANPQGKEDALSKPKWQQIMGLPCLVTQCKAILLCSMCYLCRASHACEMQRLMMLLWEEILMGSKSG